MSELDEFSRTREALFKVRVAITVLEKEEKHVLTTQQSLEFEPSGQLWRASKKDMGLNFKKNILEELDMAIERLAKIREHLSGI
jgi:hypothetical protein